MDEKEKIIRKKLLLLRHLGNISEEILSCFKNSNDKEFEHLKKINEEINLFYDKVIQDWKNNKF